MHADFTVTLKGTNSERTVGKTKWLQCFLVLRENKEDPAAWRITNFILNV